MPIRKDQKALYPENWPEISRGVVQGRAGGRCEKCGAENGKPNPRTGSRVVLACAHLNHDPTDCDPGNLAALCQYCHLRHDRHHHRACPATLDLFAGAA